MMKVMKHWERLTIEVVDGLFLETFKVRLDDVFKQPGRVEGVPAYCRAKLD